MGSVIIVPSAFEHSSKYIMPARFIHTADWQTGKPFEYIDDENKRARARQERVNMITRVGEAARAHEAEFILVAGDLFDSNTAAKAEVSATCAAIGALGLPVYVIPGNHDHGGPGSVWEQAFFRSERAALAPNLHVLLEAAPVELATAVLLPCPLLRRHEAADTTAWLRTLDYTPWTNKPRVVIAHGSVQNFGAVSSAEADDENDPGSANHLDIDRLPAGELDYVALGDWHGAKQISPHAWYSGTPEQDRFAKGEDNLPGHVLAVSASRGAPPVVAKILTGRLRWHRIEWQAAGAEDVAALNEQLTGLTGLEAGEHLVRLVTSGHLGMDGLAALEQALEVWQARLMHLRVRGRVEALPTVDEEQMLTQMTDAPLTARVAARLLERAKLDGDEGEIARLALRELHAALRQPLS